MRAAPWIIIFVLAFTVYAFFGLLSLGKCMEQEPVLVCLFDKGWKQ